MVHSLLITFNDVNVNHVDKKQKEILLKLHTPKLKIHHELFYLRRNKWCDLTSTRPRGETEPLGETTSLELFGGCRGWWQSTVS
mmetsp:Transcript_9558/g.17230  ORF Transcript_9558/g.17230 Transcript_9558/m.17230 type:complete len:84 (+) Transcript_9558:344-595(+)